MDRESIQKCLLSSQTTTSVWINDVKQKQQKETLFDNDRFVESELPSQADVVIVGAGISGISLAYWLQKEKINNVVVLEAGNSCCRGATGRNGGHCWPSGEFEDEEDVVALKQENFKLISTFIKENNIECDWIENKGGFCGIETEEEFNDESEWLKGMSTFQSIQHATLYKDRQRSLTEMPLKHDYIGAVVEPFAASLSPVKLAEGILNIIFDEKESNEFQPTLVLDCFVRNVVRDDNDEERRLKIETKKGTILAKKIVYCTNAYTSILIPSLADHIRTLRGQCVLVKPIQQKLEYNLSFDDGYCYLIQRKDKSIVFGGARKPDEEWDTADDSKLNESISKNLRVWLDKLIGKDAYEIEREWTGIMAFTADEKPIVGALDEQQNELAMCAFNGNGMAQAFICARELSKLIAGKPNSIPKVFSPHRFNKK